MATFAEQLSKVRKEHQITQEQLAKELNISRTTISRWESGKALPDIETIKQMSQLLSFNFFTVDELTEHPSDIPSAETAAAAPVEAPDAPPPAPVNPKPWMPVVGGVCLLILCLALLSLLPKEESDSSADATPTATVMSTSAPTATPTQEPTEAPTEVPTEAPTAEPLPRAEIVVIPEVSVAYPAEFGADSGNTSYGWDVNFAFQNKSNVPFTPDRVVGYYYQDDKLIYTTTVSYEYLRVHMNNNKLLSINDPLNWPFGTNDLSLTHLTVAIYGTDDNGHEIEASATVQYLHEFADAVDNPPSDEAVQDEPSLAETGADQSSRAEIVITPSDTIAYIRVISIENGQEIYGWHVDFLFENRSDVPFHIQKIVGAYYQNDSLYSILSVTQEDLLRFKGTDQLLKNSEPIEWSFSSNQFFLTHFVCTIYGTDDNGHEIEASVTVQYSQEFAGS